MHCCPRVLVPLCFVHWCPVALVHWCLTALAPWCPYPCIVIQLLSEMAPWCPGVLLPALGPWRMVPCSIGALVHGRPSIIYMCVYIYIYIYIHTHTCMHRVKSWCIGALVHCCPRVLLLLRASALVPWCPRNIDT